MGLTLETLLALISISGTAPMAMGTSETNGAAPSLTMVLVTLTEIIGAMSVARLLDAMELQDWRARGFALGVPAHGISTERAFQLNETAGVYAGLGMGLNAILTAILAPLVVAPF